MLIAYIVSVIVFWIVGMVYLRTADSPYTRRDVLYVTILGVIPVVNLAILITAVMIYVSWLIEEKGWYQKVNDFLDKEVS